MPSEKVISIDGEGSLETTGSGEVQNTGKGSPCIKCKDCKTLNKYGIRFKTCMRSPTFTCMEYLAFLAAPMLRIVKKKTESKKK